MSSSILDSKVLCLNKNYQPVRFISVRESFLKVFGKVAEIVCVENDVYNTYSFSDWTEVSELKYKYESGDADIEWIGTPTKMIMVPKVIRLLYYNKIPTMKVRLTRQNIFERDKHTCQYCGKKFKLEDLTIEHILPRSRGGMNSWENLVCACIPCNRKKRDRTPDEASMKLLSVPRRPKENAALKLKVTSKRYKDWDHFLTDIYFNVELRE
jgi:5-methylcytosine-specific restriction endonuclease McrA